MAISYGSKLFESESTSQSASSTLLGTVPAGGLVCIALAGKRSSASLNVSSITDTYGNTWDWKFYPSTYRGVGVAWCRTSVTMVAGSFIRVTWNGTPTYAWKSAHYFSGASGTPDEEATAAGTGSSASVTLDVTGSDWLTFASIMLPDDYGVTATGLNSSTSRDDNANASSSPWAECFSRNGSAGTTHTIGASFVASLVYAIAGVSFPAEALAAPAVSRSFAFIPGV